MNILESICQKKRQEIEIKKRMISIKQLQQSSYFNTTCHSLKSKLKNELGIIAEFKRKSPSKGIINANAQVEEIVIGYEKNQATAISVLTDVDFFGAYELDFVNARTCTTLPLLRKDFIVDEYQVYETKSMGADVMLLIARILTVEKAKELSLLAKQLGMEVLLEVHTANEIEQFIEIEPDLVGVNNRNLNSFEVAIENSIKLCQLIPNDVIKIAESGIHSKETLKIFIDNGFNGFLIGEYFMKHDNPHEKCAELTQFLKKFHLSNY